jgi:hypothetical protein
MKYFSSASQMTALGPIVGRERGSIELAAEGSWVPTLSPQERFVGFDGFKQEDLNRTPVVGRLRATFGLGAKTAVTLGVVPPFELDDLKPRLLSMGVERPFWEQGPWSAGLRLYVQVGRVEGSLTCTAEDAAAAPGSPGNLFGCRGPSDDEVELQHYALELVAARVLSERWTAHVGLSGIRHDLEFQVDALTFDIHDLTVLRSDGDTYALTAGATLQLGAKWQLGVEGFYAPLDRIESPVFSAGERNLLHDHLFNARGILRYKIR